MSDVTDGQEQTQKAPPQEAKAREMGWKPKEEWEGDDSGWMPADDFLARNERIKSKADSIAKAENARLTAQIGNLNKVVEDLKDHMSRAEQGAYKRALAEIKADQRQAVKDGDEAAFEEAERKADALQKDAEAAKPNGAAPNPDEDPEFVAWLPENSWYDPNDDGFDIEMSDYADRAAPQLAKTGLKGKALYERVTKEVRKKFPDKFENPKRKAAAAVETGGGGKKPAKKGYADLPTDAKAACDRLVAQKVWDRPSKNVTLSDKEAKERYASEFFAGEE